MIATVEFGEYDPESSILFLGSGFSMDALNIAGKNPPNGRFLRRHFIDKLSLPENTDYDLQILTEEFANNDSKKLRDELYNMFRIRLISDTQKVILKENWRRIYTTNYDDIVETSRLNSRKSPDAFDISESVPNKLPHGSVIHLHGSIRLITPENIRESIVLSEASYVNQYVIRSPWYDQFQRDIAFATALYIVGYSLSDYHIAGLLLANPTLASRTTFIQGPQRDEIFLRRTAAYGRTLFIGTEGFGSALARAPRPAPPTIDNLRSFRSLAPTRDKKASARPTATEVYDLLVYGDFNPGRLARSQPGEDYAIARRYAVEKAASIVENSAALVVDGRLGNGKSLFLHLLAFELSARGWTCLLFRPGHPETAREIAALSAVKRLVVFIENYPAAQDALVGLREALPTAKLVVEIRTGTYEVRFHDLAGLLPKPFDRVSLNALSREEMIAFSALCKNAGIQSPESDKLRELRDILLELFDNCSIKERVLTALFPLFEKISTRRLMIMTMLVAGHQGSISAAFARSIVGADPFTALKPLEHLSKEIFDVSADAFRVRSSVFSEFVIKTFIEPNEIADAVVEITLAAAKRRSERPYRVLMSNMMAYTSLRRTLRGKADPTAIIIGIYERLRFDERVNAEPLFWLQYAIVMAELPKLDAAEEYIANAYRKAESLPGFQTYQIDTQAFRIALARAIEEAKGAEVSNIDQILSGMARINAMITDNSHRAYAIRVLEGIEPFVAARRKDLTAGRSNSLAILASQDREIIV